LVVFGQKLIKKVDYLQLCRPVFIKFMGSTTMPPQTKAIQIETLNRPDDAALFFEQNRFLNVNELSGYSPHKQECGGEDPGAKCR
jgi:hypothetical protein